MIAERMGRIDASGIRKVFDLAAEMKDPVNLSIGQPDFDVPEAVKEAAINAIRAGHNKYTQTQGISALRSGIMEQLSRQGRLRAGGDDEIMITSGTSGGLLEALMVLINPGDEVLIPDPYFVMYKQFVNFIGGAAVYIDTYPDFQLTAARVEAALSPRTKMLIVNSPANPTGAVIPGDELRAIGEICNRHGIWVLSDEVYSIFCYDTPYRSIFPLVERGILVDGFSKSHAMTGWRIGYAVGPREVIQEMIKLQQYSFVCAPSMAQYGALAALGVDMRATVAAYRRKRDLVYEGLREHYELPKPGGAFYAFVRAPGASGSAFVARAVERGLLIIPGNVFSERDTHFRISYAASDETIERGIAILRDLARIS
ncbi:MAG: pyridoxal phosphate-dependent aminotransferase [bacterium]|nr:pyridoxal phosphate-dependent aminotransferase [bacterium]